MAHIAIISQRLLGHVIPALGVGNELANRGHHVHFLGHRSYRSLVEETKISFEEMEWGKFPTVHIKEMMDELITKLGGMDVDLILNDSGLAAPAYTAELLGIPWGSFQTSIPWSDRLLPGSPVIIQRERRRYEKELNRVRAKFDLQPLRNPSRTRGDWSGISPHLHLVMVSEEMLTNREEWPLHYAVVGACSYQGERGSITFERPPDEKVLFICSSSISRPEYRSIMSQYIEAALNVFADEQIHLLLSEQSKLRIQALIPRNTSFFPHMPIHDQLLPYADAALTHGGCNTLHKMLKYGVPMVIVPLGDDQLRLANICRSLGVAVVLKPNELSEESIKRSVTAVMNSGEMNAAAQQIKERLRRCDPNRLAAEHIEQLLQSIGKGQVSC